MSTEMVAEKHQLGPVADAMTREHAPARRGNAAIYLAAAWSGFFVMGIELLGGRLLAPYFGTSIFVWGALIAVFMTCLAIGYLLGGQLSLRSPSRQRLGLLLVGEALLAVPILLCGDVMLEWLSYAVPDPRYGSLLGAALLFGAPTLFSGMISPYAVRLLIDDLNRSGRSAGRLYFASTLGSAAGTILTSFYLVLWFELDTIIVSLIAMSFVAGLALLAAGRRGERTR
ncbi:fused MFS/spermidine synthase [Xanthomonas vasicola]|uniref:Glycosyl transferase n=1 Tax=Xanthomonas vasicola pv. vasculorum NCPPB 890 TaxID=1184265 RepID=A0A837B560_XANVA|nr:fused MFS/spermidine synthase [Xanthomonas vasicola]MBV6747175.1 fused MFS/spermidine synthase [Xanthomonas vasicola pv. vasculorum NCPPB 890]MBV6892754.1 fused MFS/spermidine synthase [Xanthomonas vasicola pv. vasculorum]MDO6948458.1 fused MFS/spermidine synthase [Xanthomonas vasicola]MDO6960504.1 fused MFS/spermidine synthase [Xanthomonas vasicola]